MLPNQKEVVLSLLREYGEILFGNDPYGFVKKGDFVGVVSAQDGELVLPAVYRGRIDPKDSLHKLIDSDKKAGLFSTQTGDWVIPPEFGDIDRWSAKNEFQIVVNRTSRVYSLKGVYSLAIKKLIIPVLYDTVLFLSPSHVFVAKIGECGIFDAKNSQWVFTFTDDTGDEAPKIWNLKRKYSEEESSIWSIEINGKLGIFSLNKNQLIVPIECDSIENGHECESSPFWSVYLGERKSGIFSDITGTFVVPAEYEATWPISDTVAVIVDFNSWTEGLYSMTKGKVLLPIKYNHNFSKKISDTLYLVQEEESHLYGVFSEKTESFAVPVRYEEPIKHIIGELFEVCVDGNRLIFNVEDQTETFI